MKRIFSFLVSALVGSMMALANCPSIPFHQSGPEDYYSGLNPRSVQGFYYDMATQTSNCQDCDPALNWTYAWKDGVALKGVFGGSSEWQCRGINCPMPWIRKGCRMVVVLSSSAGEGTRYIIDTVPWNNEENAFEFNNSNGAIHTAGWLKPPIVTQNLLQGDDAKVNVIIPVPRGGFYSDTGFDARNLVWGIAVLGMYSTSPPASLQTNNFKVLSMLRVNLATLPQDPTLMINVQVDALRGTNCGIGYYAYTLVAFLEEADSLINCVDWGIYGS